jgi:thioredoxin 1
MTNKVLNLRSMKKMSETVKEVTDNSFESEVRQAKKPVLVDFWAEWCGPCRMLAPTIEAIAEEHSGAVSVVKLNVDENPTTAAVYGIKGIPTLMLFSDGKEVERIVGVASKDTIVRTIAKHAKLENTERQAA